MRIPWMEACAKTIVALLYLMASCALLVAGDFDEWSLVNLEPDAHGMTNALLLRMTSGNGRAVVVGTLGTILSTSNGGDWVAADPTGSSVLGAPGTQINNVAFGNGLFVAVGYQFVAYSTDALFLSSTDAVHWTEQRLRSNAVYGVTFGADRFVAVGKNGNVFTSADGFAWQFQGNPTTNDLYDVTFGNNLFVAVGPNTLLTSADGTNWVNNTPSWFGYWTEFITYSQGQFLVLDRSYRYSSSPDGTNWTIHLVTTNGSAALKGICATETSFLAVGGGLAFSSSDGITWTNSPTVNAESLYGCGFWNDTALVFGTKGTIAQTQPFFGPKRPPTFLRHPQSCLLRSDATAILGANAVSWPPLAFQWQQETGALPGATTLSLGLPPGFTNAGSYSLIASNSSGVSTSRLAIVTRVEPVQPVPPSQSPVAQGQSVSLGVVCSGTLPLAYQWRRNQQPIPGATTSTLSLTNAQFSDAMFFDVAVTNSHGAVTNAGLTLVVEPYALHPFYHWLDRSTAEIRSALALPSGGGFAGFAGFHGIAYGAGRFVAVSGTLDTDPLFTSSDGQHWTVAATLYGLYDVTFANNTFVAVGWSGAIYTSTDALHWVLRPVGTYNTFTRVIYAAPWFYAYPSGGSVLRSPDGVSWSAASSYPALGRRSASGAGYTLSLVNTNGGSQILISTNGVSWTVAYASPTPLTGVAYGNGSFVVVGQNATILQTSPVANLALSYSQKPNLSVYGLVGHDYQIECRPTLADPWSNLATLTLTNSPVNWQDPVAPAGQRFYRTLMLP